MLCKFVAAALLLARLSNAKLLASPAEAANTQYDFIVVGGGTAGSVVASRLSESCAKVLVIEAGAISAGTTESVPFLGPELIPNKPWDWNYTTTAQPGLNNRTVPFPRGKVLGGCSSINYMIYNPGGLDDFDRYASVAGNDRWSWNSVQPYRLKAEGFVLPPPADGDRFNIAYHGTTGPLKTTLPLWPTEIDDMIVDATSQLDGFPYTRDMNGGNEIGIGYVYASIGSDDGAPPNRTSSATAYLLPNVNRHNLDVLIETQVTRVLQTDTVDGLPVFKGVEFSQGSGQTIYNITATNEVILSAGAINTAQILMLSGIGDMDELSSVGIDAIVDLPEVGSNLQDHPLLPYQWYVNSTNTWEAGRNATVASEWMSMYNTNGTGPMVNTLATLIGWLRVPADSDAWEGEADPSSGPTVGHYELFFSNGFLGPTQETPATGNFLSIITNLVTPASRGSVKLASSSPWDNPLIDVGFLDDEIDLRLLREGFKAAQKFVTAPAFADYIVGPYLSDPVETDADIEAYIRKYTSTVWHPVSTATISPDDSDDGVVDSNLLVKKVSGLRVVDASILPYVPAAHPEAVIYTISEVASDVIKAAYGL